MRHGLTRLITVAAMLGSALTLAGGTLIATTTPASAAEGGANVCASFAGTVDLTTGVITETYSGCHQQGSATDQYTLGQTSPITIHWATGNATSDVVASSVIDPAGPCPTGEISVDVTLTVVGGAYAGSTGDNVICSDISGLPIVHNTNLGPIVI
jgi:hypothetical protein